MSYLPSDFTNVYAQIRSQKCLWFPSLQTTGRNSLLNKSLQGKARDGAGHREKVRAKGRETADEVEKEKKKFLSG